MLPLAIPLITTGVGLAANLYGQSKANKAAGEQEDYLNQRKRDLNTMLNKNYYQNYLDTEGSRAALELMRKNMKEATKITANKAVQGGATPEAVIAQEGNQQNKYQDAVLNLTQVGQQKKDQDFWRFQALNNNLDDQKQGLLANKANQWNQFSQNVNGATSGILSSWAMGAFNGGTGQPQDKDLLPKGM